MSEIERKESAENEESDPVKKTRQLAEAILSNLRKAAEAYAQLIAVTKLTL